MAGKVKRNEIMTYMDTTPTTTATYSLIGDGVPSGKIAYNPKTESVAYISDENASVSVEGYAPTMAVEQIAIAGNAVFDYIESLLRTRAILDDAETSIVNVWAYESGGPTAYPAEKQPVVITIEDFGGDGGTAAKINYTIHYNGDPIAGTFNTSTSAFTPS
jgi:hypothetical protein